MCKTQGLLWLWKEIITEGQSRCSKKDFFFLKKGKSGTHAQSRNLTNSYCKITPGQPTTISINISQDQQPRQIGGGGEWLHEFFLKIKIVLLTVGKEGGTHHPTKWEAHEEKKDCNSTHPSGHPRRNLDSQTILKLFYNSVFFAAGKKIWYLEFIRAAILLPRLPRDYSGWEQPKALWGLIWVVHPSGSEPEKDKPL